MASRHSQNIVASFAYPRQHRVTRGADIEQVRKEGKRVRTASMEVRAIASLGVSITHGSATRRSATGRSATAAASATPDIAEDASANPNPPGDVAAVARVGVVVPKYGKSSVERNLLKRRLRELVRMEVLPVLPVLDVVIKTAPRAYTRTFDELREEVRKWTHQLKTSPVLTGRGLK